jgi:hypothetical protein
MRRRGGLLLQGGALLLQGGALLRQGGGLLRQEGGLLRQEGGLLRQEGGLLRPAPTISAVQIHPRTARRPVLERSVLLERPVLLVLLLLEHGVSLPLYAHYLLQGARLLQRGVLQGPYRDQLGLAQLQ